MGTFQILWVTKVIIMIWFFKLLKYYKYKLDKFKIDCDGLNQFGDASLRQHVRKNLKLFLTSKLN